MQRVLIFCLCVCLWASTASAGELRRLLTADDAKAWTGVGRLNIAGQATCTGALIAPDRVLTAAHCVVNTRTALTHAPSSIHFLAGWRQGRAVAHRKAKRVIVSEGFDTAVFSLEPSRATVAQDLAVIELDRPIDGSQAKPFDIQTHPRRGSDLTVVSYGRGRNEVASIEEGCTVLARDARVLVSDCSATFGSSGAPIFVVKDGVPRVASVMSATGSRFGKDIALGVALGDPLDDILTKLDAPAPFQRQGEAFQGIKPSGKSIAEQLGRR